jgi:hypothetical protein
MAAFLPTSMSPADVQLLADRLVAAAHTRWRNAPPALMGDLKLAARCLRTLVQHRGVDHPIAIYGDHEVEGE